MEGMSFARWLAACLTLLALATNAWAQRDPKDEARELATRGYEKFKEGSYDEAIALFQQADALQHSVVIVSYMAQAYEQLGKLIEAQQAYARIVDEVLPDDASEDRVTAQKRARAHIPILARRIPRVKLTISGVSLDDVEVTLDGRPVSQVDLARPLMVNPGERVLLLRAPGYQPIERVVTATERQLSDVELMLATREVVVPKESDRDWVGPVTAFAAGGAGLVLGIATGILYLERAADLRDRCPADRCAPELEGEKDTIDAIGIASLVGFGVALVGGGIGTGLWLAGRDDPPSAGVALRISPAGAVVVGAF